MIVWALCGIAIGWYLARRLAACSLALFLVSSVIVPLMIFVVSKSFDIETMVGFIAFWIAVQASYLIGNYRGEEAAPAAVPAPAEGLHSA